MGHSEDYIRNKMYEIEREKLEIEKHKANALRDISELLTAIATIEMAKMDEHTTFTNMATYQGCKKLLGEVMKSIEKRWSE